MAAKLDITLKTVGCPEVKRSARPATQKFVRRRLRVKTPTLKGGIYAGCSVPDVMHHSMRYWKNYVSHNPYQLVGSLSVFEEFDAREKERVQQKHSREMFRHYAMIMARANARKPVERPPDYIYTGCDIIKSCNDKSANLVGRPFSDILRKREGWKNRELVRRYETGSLKSPHCCDLARYIRQEYRACRYHYH